MARGGAGDAVSGAGAWRLRDRPVRAANSGPEVWPGPCHTRPIQLSSRRSSPDRRPPVSGAARQHGRRQRPARPSDKKRRSARSPARASVAAARSGRPMSSSRNRARAKRPTGRGIVGDRASGVAGLACRHRIVPATAPNPIAATWPNAADAKLTIATSPTAMVSRLAVQPYRRENRAKRRWPVNHMLKINLLLLPRGSGFAGFCSRANPPGRSGVRRVSPRSRYSDVRIRP